MVASKKPSLFFCCRFLLKLFTELIRRIDNNRGLGLQGRPREAFGIFAKGAQDLLNCSFERTPAESLGSLVANLLPHMKPNVPSPRLDPSFSAGGRRRATAERAASDWQRRRLAAAVSGVEVWGFFVCVCVAR